MNKIIFSYFLHQFTMNKFIFRLILHQFNFFWIILSSTGCSVDGSRARTNWGVGHGPTGLWGTSQRCCGARANYGGHGPTTGGGHSPIKEGHGQTGGFLIFFIIIKVPLKCRKLHTCVVNYKNVEITHFETQISESKGVSLTSLVGWFFNKTDFFYQIEDNLS